MEQLRKRDLLALLEFIKECYGIYDIDAFAHRVISKLPKIVPSDITSYNEVNPRRKRNHYLAWPQDAYGPSENRIFEQHMHEHPLIVHNQKTRDTRALKISDFLTQRKFHRLALYNEFFRPLSVEYQIAFGLPSPPSLTIGIALNRTRRDFSERDRLLLNLLSPHLIQAYRNAEAFTRIQQEMAVLKQTLEKLDRGVIVLTPNGRVRLATARAVQRLKEYFGSGSQQGNRLPESLQRWVRHQEALLEVEDDALSPRKPLVVERKGKRLVVRLVSDSDQSMLLLLEEQQMSIYPASLEPLGLARRQAEVLSWVAQGKTNAEIGTILDMSPRTVQKHLEHIFQKLGAETRTAAAMRAMEIISHP
jgi:DNA-binding CsgD family transcriptional regulator